MRVAHWLETLCALSGISRRSQRGRHRRRATSPQLERLEERVLLATWSGDIPNGTVWPAGQVQQITGDVHIPLGSTLTIQQGAVVKFNNNSDIDFIVDGTLLAQGTAGQPIVFTELRDDTGGDTNGDGAASGPGRRNWGALIIQPGSTGSILNNVELRYGGWRAAAELVVNGGQLTVNNGVIREADNFGARITNASPTFNNISFINNGGQAVSMDLNSSPTISGVTMTNNGWNGVWLDSGTLPDNATWNNPDIVYILPDNVTVPQGKTLTLGPGQIIKTGFRTELVVNGTLIANGTAAKPVIFANPADDTAGGDTNNNGAANNASNDASGGIVFSATSTGSVLDHVEVRDSGFDVDAAIVVNGASITLTNSVISRSRRAGVSINSGTATVTDTLFQSCTWEAINATPSSLLTFHGNTFTANVLNGLLMRGGSLVADATWNNPDIVYVLQDDVTVPQGITLTIGPGQIIKRSRFVDLLVNGTLDAQGIFAAPIIFTSGEDDSAGGDTNNNGAGVPNFGDTGSIQFSSFSTANVMDYVELRYGATFDPASLIVDGADLTFTNGFVRNTNANAILVRNNGELQIENSVMFNNFDAGIRAESGATVTAINNTIDGNQRGVTTDGSGTTVELINNLITNNGTAGIVQSNQGVVTARFNDVFNPSASAGNYNGISSLTGINGNLSVDPKYVNRLGLDFHLQTSSPVIDAGTSEGAPEDDRDFSYRTDNPAVTNTGAGSSPFNDLGAYESAGRPRAVKNSPSGDVAGVVSQVVLTFRGAMDTTSFSPVADVVSFTGPDGPLSVAGFRWLNKYQLMVSFNTLAKAGPYELVLGPNILNASGQALDTDGDGTRGESVQDRYAAKWTITPPRVVAQSPADFVGNTVNHVSFTFDRDMDQQSFDLSDVVSFTGPNGAIPVTGFSWTDARTLSVNFTAQTVLGAYEMVLGPNVSDLGGNLLDQSRNGVAGEAAADRYTANFTLAQIAFVSGNITQNTTWAGLIIVQGNVSVQAGVTLTISPGTIIKVKDDLSIAVETGATLQANGTAALPIRFTSIHDDSVGGDSDLNNDRVGPQPGDWSQIINRGTSTFNYTHVLYGSGVGNTGLDSGAIRNSGGQVNFSNSVLAHAFFDGIDSVGGTVNITNSVIYDTDRAVVSTFAGTTISILNSTIDNNRIGVFAHGSGSISVRNSIVSNSLEAGIDTDSGPQTITYSDVYSTVPNSINYRGMTSATGTNGNISADPKFVNPEGENYRLKVGSPAIDAANGSLAPTTDQAGSPRFDDPRAANTGTTTSNNAYADMGAFEFVEGAPSNLDLIVSLVDGPATATQGDTITVQWTARNVGTETANGSWHDDVYLSADPIWSPDDVLIGQSLHSGSVGPTQTYTNSGDFVMPGLVPGSYYFLVRTNSDKAVFEGANQTNNVGASSQTITTTLPALTLGTPTTGTLAETGAAMLYQVTTTAGSDLNLVLTGPSGNSNQLYVSFGVAPTREAFDLRGAKAGTANQSVTVSNTRAGTYYVLVYGASVPASEQFQLTASNAVFSVSSVEPAQGGNTGLVTLTINGNRFDAASHPQLVDSSGATIQPLQVYYTDSGAISATFDLTGRPTGAANVQVVNAGNVTRSLPQGFNIIPGQAGKLTTSISTPDAVRRGRTYAVTIEYTNTGTTDLLAPILNVTSSTGDPLSFTRDFTDTTGSLTLIGVNPNGPAGILPPGAHGTITIYCLAETSGKNILKLTIGNYPGQPIDWAGIEPIIRPTDIPVEQWHNFVNRLAANIGDTWDDFARAISQDATLISPDVGRNISLADVFQLEIAKVKGQIQPALTGHIYLGDANHPLGNAKITIGVPETGVIYDVTSLMDGSFLIPFVDAGTYEVEIAGFISGTAQLVVGDDGLSNVELIATPAGAISGRIINSQGAPLPGILVGAVGEDGKSYLATTSEDGTYLIDSLPAGTYEVDAGGGSLTSSLVSDIIVASGGRTGNVNLALQAAATISGAVIGPDGPVAGALVSAANEDGVGSSVFTDATGHYTISGLSSGLHTVTVSDADLAGSEKNNVNVNAGGAVSGINFTLTVAGTVTGQISLVGTGEPAAGMLVTLSGAAGDFPGFTDDTGTFLVTSLPAGTYTVVATLSGYMTTQSQVTVTPDQTATANLTTNVLGTVTGQMTDSITHAPLPKVIVQVLQNSVLIEYTLTDATGHYTIDGLDAGTYQVVLGDLGSPGVATTNITLSKSQTQATANLSVSLAGTVEGTVFQADGVTPLADAIVSLFSQGTQVLFMTTDSAGHYVFDILKSGSYDIAASIEGEAFPTRTGVTVSGGQALTALDFRAGQQVLSGTIRDHASNQPLTGASVNISYLDPAIGAITIETVTTAADGTFAISGAIPGTWSIEVSAAGHAALTQSVTVPASGPKNVAIALTAGSAITGTVRNSSTAAALEDVTLQLVSTSGPQIIAVASTDAFGHYQMDGLTPGTYRLLVQADGKSSVLVNNFVVGTGSTVRDVSLASSTSTVQGTVAAGGLPLGNALVQIRDTQGLLWSTTTANDTGVYSITGLPAGQYVATAAVIGYQANAAVAFSLTVNQTLSNFNLSASAVAITDADPPAGAGSESNDVAAWVKALAEEDPNQLQPLNAGLADAVPCPNPTDDTKEAHYALDQRVLFYNYFLEHLQAKWPKLQKLKISFGDYYKTTNSLLATAVTDGTRLSQQYAKTDYKLDGLYELIQSGRNHLEQLQTLLSQVPQVPDSTFLKNLESRLDALVKDQVLLLAVYLKKLENVESPSASVESLHKCASDFSASLIRAFQDVYKFITILRGLEEYLKQKQSYTTAAKRLLEAYDRLVRSCNCGASEQPTVPYKTGEMPSDPNSATYQMFFDGIKPRLQANFSAAAAEAAPAGPVCVKQPVKAPGEPKPGGGENTPDSAPDGTDGGESDADVEDAFDPNDFTGPAGFGPQKFIQSQLMSYRVDFENDPNFATAAAQIVTTTFTLDADLDPATLQFTGFGFGQFNFEVPEGQFHYQTILDLRPQGINLLVPVTLDENPVTGVVSVKFESLDPLTNLPPDGVHDGFLPVDNPAKDGQGYFTFTVQPKTGLTSGTQITAQTGIIFDLNSPVQTPTALNTIDTGSPTSSVTALPGQSPANFTVNWSGSDDAGGSGIGTYDVYVSIDGGDYTIWQSAIAATSATYTGQAGKTYRFYSVAHDNVGHVELAPLTADTLTTVANLPPAISDQSFNVPENSATNTVVGTVQASGSSALTYSIVSGNIGNAFSIDQATGSIKVAAGATLNFEGTTTYTLTVQVADSDSPSKSSSASMTIHITDINEAPSIASGQSFNISPSANDGAVVGTVTATDPDIAAPNSTRNFSFPNGSTTFSINSATGQITVANATALVALAGQTVTLQVKDTDGGSSPLSVTQDVTINVAPANTAPVLANPGPVSTFFGNLKTPVRVAPTLTVTDADGSATLASIIISLPLGAVKKNPDIVTLPGMGNVGTRVDAIVSGRLQITITLKPGATNSAVQTMLDGMTFSTKAKGLKVPSRNFQIQVIDQSGLHSNVVSQNVTVLKKAPKPPRQPR